MFQGKEYIIIACVWLLIGLLSVMFLCVYDMRGKPYDENYFEDQIHYAIVLILMGGFTFFIVVFEILQEKYEKRKKSKMFTKFIYKIANIGVKKDNNIDDKIQNEKLIGKENKWTKNGLKQNRKSVKQ